MLSVKHDLVTGHQHYCDAEAADTANAVWRWQHECLMNHDEDPRPSHPKWSTSQISKLVVDRLRTIPLDLPLLSTLYPIVDYASGALH